MSTASTTTHDGLAAIVAGVGTDPALMSPGIITEAQVLNRPIDIYRLYLANIIASLANCEVALVYQCLQTPSTLVNGDLVIPVPRLRLEGKKPQEQCLDLAAQFSSHPLIQHAKASGIHLSFYFAPQPLTQVLLPYIFDRRDGYGKNLDAGLRDPTNPGAGRKKVIVEFSSPNIAKEFHAGHLRSTIIGAYIANLYESMGWDVRRVNYLGDWGKQFGLLAVGWERFGSEEELAHQPLKHLLDVYAKINALFKPEQDASKAARKDGRDTSDIESQGIFAERNAYFKRMEDGDPEVLALWKRFRDISIERYVATYERLNIRFDEYSGESQVKAETVNYVEQVLKAKGVYEEHEGSWIIDFTKYGAKALAVAVVRGRTGTTTYLLRDVAAVLEREREHGFDKMIYVVSSEQDVYFKRVFKVIELMGRPDLATRLQHVNFGKVMGMSSRLGNVKLLSDILDQSREAMHEVMRGNPDKYAQVPDPDAVAEAIGTSAVMVQDMRGKRINDYPFDISRMTSFEGDTGPYLQYCHARLKSILRKAGVTQEDIASHVSSLKTLNTDITSKPQCADLLRVMAQYPNVTATALGNLEPSTILTYLFRLTHQVSSCYDVLQVVGQEHMVTLSRATLFERARLVLANGMKLLGLNPVERYVTICSQWYLEHQENSQAQPYG